jgi:hypothetical protein
MEYKKENKSSELVKKNPDNSLFGTLRLLVVDFRSGKNPS